MLQDLEPQRVELVVGIVLFTNWRARGGSRIEDRLGKDALPLRQRRNHAEPRDAGPQPRPLPVREEECLVGLNRSAHRRAILVAAEFRIRSRLREQVPGVQRFIAEELEQRSRGTDCFPDFPITITVPPFDRPYSGE